MRCQTMTAGDAQHFTEKCALVDSKWSLDHQPLDSGSPCIGAKPLVTLPISSSGFESFKGLPRHTEPIPYTLPAAARPGRGPRARSSPPPGAPPGCAPWPPPTPTARCAPASRRSCCPAPPAAPTRAKALGSGQGYQNNGKLGPQEVT